MNYPSGWQPIETAPKDGSYFLAWGHRYGMRNTFYTDWFDNINQKWCCGFRCAFSLDDAREATHWMPLPEPPR